VQILPIGLIVVATTLAIGAVAVCIIRLRIARRTRRRIRRIVTAWADDPFAVARTHWAREGDIWTLCGVRVLATVAPASYEERPARPKCVRCREIALTIETIRPAPNALPGPGGRSSGGGIAATVRGYWR
jgi:hypothetical protein